MKHAFLLSVIFPLMVLITGCQQEEIEPAEPQVLVSGSLNARQGNETCTNYFYYYGQQQVQLGNPVATHLVVGFPDGYTTEQKNAVLSGYAFFRVIEIETNSGSADATVIGLREGLSCAQVSAAAQQLNQNSQIRYANPVFINPQDDNLLGVTNQFIVTLEPQFGRADLDQLIRKSNTRVVDQLGDYTFILSADKYSTGNALETANYFAQSNKIESAEPDFLYFGSGTAGGISL